MPDAAGRGGAAAPGISCAGGVPAVYRYAFAQLLMRRGFMPESEAKESVGKLVGDADVALYEQVLSDQNKAMSPCNLQIRTIIYPVDGKKWVGFVNTEADEPAKSATRYPHLHRDFFKQVVETIALDEGALNGAGSAPEMVLLNLHVSRPINEGPNPTVQNLSKAEKTKALGALCEDGWLARSRKSQGHYCIGVRTFLELNKFLFDLDLPDATKQAWRQCL